jgi:hypothetical protein
MNAKSFGPSAGRTEPDVPVAAFKLGHIRLSDPYTSSEF